MRIATIDIGTNTVLLLIADVHPDGSIETLREEQRIIRLGRDVDALRNIGPEGFRNGEAVLRSYRKLAEDLGCERITAAGTSAIRDARNREAFVLAMLEHTGLRIDVLSGNDEALWTFRGGRLVWAGRDLLGDRALVIDIGGGSTEFIQGDSQHIEARISLDIGAVRMTERFIEHDPAEPEEEAALRSFLQAQFTEQLSAFDRAAPGSGVGVAGTITTLAAMMQDLAEYDPARINGFVIDHARLNAILAMLRTSTLEERKQLKGLQPERADVILAGGVILSEALTFFGLSSLTVSNYGLRYGLVLREMERARHPNA